jgi:hypothetical protein
MARMVEKRNATRDTIRGTDHHHRTYGSTAGSSAILETTEDDKCWSEHTVTSLWLWVLDWLIGFIGAFFTVSFNHHQL